MQQFKKLSKIILLSTEPDEVKDYFLNSINPEWFLLLQQFVLHKQLHLNRISRILGMDESKTLHLIESLKRSGLVVELKQSIFHINPYVHNLISKKLAEMDLL